MTAGVVVFDYPTWAARYPELAASVGAPLAAMYFAEAGLYCDNAATSIISDLTRRALILNMLTAHIAALNASVNGQPAPGLVGRIASATEGSVTVSADYQVPGTAAWYAQTRYGAAAWQAMASNRTAFFVPGYSRNMNPGWPQW
jgi:hypothetical protein